MSEYTPTQRLRLYVAGGGWNSRQAVLTVSELCARPSLGPVQLDVIDVYRQPQLAQEDGIRGVPALVRMSPGPVRRLVGDLSDESRLMSIMAGAATRDSLPP